MRLEWGEAGIGVTGLDRGVLYLADGTGVPWNGLTGATEKPGQVESTRLYYDGVQFGVAQGDDEFSLSVEAWAHPLEFNDYEGYVDDIYTRQPHKPFGFSYRVEKNESHEIHIVWNAMASPIDKPYSSRNNELEISLFQWEFVTRPKNVTGLKPTGHFFVDTNFAPEEAVEALEEILYGTDLADPRIPEPQEVIDLFLDHAVLVVTDNGDGTATVTGPDEAILMLTADKVRINWPSVYYKTPEKVNISSM